MMFPFIDGPLTTETPAQGTREYAWDFGNDDFALRDGKQYIVEDAEALKVWIYHCLKTPRYRYMAYSWNYGSELHTLIGQKLSEAKRNSEAKRMTEEALLINPAIMAVQNVSTELVKNKLIIYVDIQTIYGEVSVSV